MKTNIKLDKATKLYHMTPASKVDAIMKEGLNTFERKGFCAYEGKLLFMWVELFTPALDDTLGAMFSERGKAENYILLEIDLSQLDKSRIFNDCAVSGHLAVCTDQAVPATAIKVLGNVFNYF